MANYVDVLKAQVKKDSRVTQMEVAEQVIKVKVDRTTSESIEIIF